ncbi:MAG TPA: GTPase HflX [Victivallales bacterium]|nr:GTPase HflX [Victivallales bacterium]
MIEVRKESETFIKKALLIGVQDAGTGAAEAREHLSELSELVKTLGINDRQEFFVVLRESNPKYLVGSGKAQEIADLAADSKSECIIFDSELSPSQQRNLEQLAKLPVMDRQEVIIDIFAGRARTKEASIQVELARLQYFLPRLKRAWTHLSRQRGGALGTRGEGEQQIEVDRRIIKRKISVLQDSLHQIRKRREVQRTLSERNQIPKVAIVGYTNAGKSSMLKAMTGADVYVEDKLFATLDTTTRRLELPDRQDIILSDTVGFIRKLPHSLVEAFKSTLEEAVFADLLIHVLDISSPFWEEHLKTTLLVIEELGAGGKEMITVLNKADIQTDPFARAVFKTVLPEAILVSAKTGEGLDALKDEISKRLRKFSTHMLLKIPPDRHDVLALAHRYGKVLKTEYAKNGTMTVSANIPKNHHAKFDSFIK